MSQDVAGYIGSIGQPWQTEVYHDNRRTARPACVQQAHGPD